MYDENLNPKLCAINYSINVNYCNPIVPATLVHAGGGELSKGPSCKKFQLAQKKKLFNPKRPTP
jgi:hypothetical protein